MPFDGTNLDQDATIAFLGKVKTLLLEKGWIRRAYEREEGSCLLGAHLVLNRGRGITSSVFAKALGFFDANYVLAWNDNLARCREDVIKRLDAAIERRRATLLSEGT